MIPGEEVSCFGDLMFIPTHGGYALNARRRDMAWSRCVRCANYSTGVALALEGAGRVAIALPEP